MKITCKKAKRQNGKPILCTARDKPCLYNFWCACKGWWELREGALSCKYAKEEQNV